MPGSNVLLKTGRSIEVSKAADEFRKKKKEEEEVEHTLGKTYNYDTAALALSRAR